jgi:hypothetical protein
VHKTGELSQKSRRHAAASLDSEGDFGVIQLVLVYCLTADRLSCIEKRPISEFPLSVMGCMVGAQPTALDFIRSHPDYELSAWRCEINKPDERAT